MVNGIAELFCTVGDGLAYQLSRTGAITRFDEFYLRDPPDFGVSPSGKKVLFSLITDFGDLAHGPLLIVNIDGTNQTVLLSDMMLMNFNHRWVGDILFFTYYSYEGQAEWLYMLEAGEHPRCGCRRGQFDVIILDNTVPPYCSPSGRARLIPCCTPSVRSGFLPLCPGS